METLEKRLSSVLWLLAVLRIKTIFFEIMERKGVQEMGQGLPNYSADGAYLNCFR